MVHRPCYIAVFLSCQHRHSHHSRSGGQTGDAQAGATDRPSGPLLMSALLGIKIQKCIEQSMRLCLKGSDKVKCSGLCGCPWAILVSGKESYNNKTKNEAGALVFARPKVLWSIFTNAAAN